MSSNKTIFLVFVLFTFIFSPIAFTAPAPPQVIVNDATKECSDYFAGDECMNCEIPSGWRSLGYMNITCPAGYKNTDLNFTCTGFKNEMCCSQGHSGAMGDCEDMLVNDMLRKCTFVDDPINCTPAYGWKEKKKIVPPSDWVCPSGYTWNETRDCPSESPGFCTPIFVLGALILGITIRK